MPSWAGRRPSPWEKQAWGCYVPWSPLSHEPQGCHPRVTEEGRPSEAKHSNFDFFSFLIRAGVGFCTRLNFEGKSFKLLKISLGTPLLEADWGLIFSHALLPLRSPQNTSVTGRNQGQNQGKLAARGWFCCSFGDPGVTRLYPPGLGVRGVISVFFLARWVWSIHGEFSANADKIAVFRQSREMDSCPLLKPACPEALRRGSSLDDDD